MLLLIATLYFALPARADVIWEPWGNEYFDNHKSEMTYLNNIVEANGPNGHVVVYLNPETNKTLTEFENGTEFIARWTIKDIEDREWALVAFSRSDSGVPEYGWVPMDYAFSVYDSEEFVEEYQDRIVWGGGNVFDFSGEYYYSYSYPGGKCLWEEGSSTEFVGHLHYNMTFVDEDGRTWGAYIMGGSKDNWFLLDDPCMPPEELYPDGPPGRDTRVRPVWADDAKEIVPIDDSIESTVPIGVIIGIVGVVLATGAVLIVMVKKKRK